MGVHLVSLVACMVVLPAQPAPPPVPAGDGIAIQSMRVVGTVPRPDSPLFNMNPYAKDRVPYAMVPHQFAGSDFCVEVVQGGTRAVVYMSLGGDKALKEQAAKLVGRRVMVECRGEYKLVTGKVSRMDNLVWVEEPVVYATVVLTVVKIQPAE
jgi:hypothetical protein